MKNQHTDRPTHIASRRALSRRGLLRAAGVSLALPLLDAMVPAFTSAAEVAKATAVGPDGKPRRML
ncbi:MAG TPA: hypothetical protein VK986_24160, partial [Tepidisphaeraceae bacterium]|nr:hypothetical protein [Tepidisphaeraceae bacterium]